MPEERPDVRDHQAEASGSRAVRDQTTGTPRAERDIEVSGERSGSTRAERETRVTTSSVPVPRRTATSSTATRSIHSESTRAERETRVTTSAVPVSRRAATASTVTRTIVPRPRNPPVGETHRERSAPDPRQPAEPARTPEASRSSVSRSDSAASVYVSSERPLICLDWHQTLSHPGVGVPGQVIDTLRLAQHRGFDLAIISFCSNLDTQRNVLREARDLEASLVRGFNFIHICNRKFLGDPPARRPSLTGCTTCKAEEVNRVGAAVFVDDQGPLLREVESLQNRRARRNQTTCLIAHKSTPSSALRELRELVEFEEPSGFPLPSLLRSLV